MARNFEQIYQGEIMQDITDQSSPEVKLLVNTDFGLGNEGSLGPETVSDQNSVKDIADSKYVEQLRAERFFCMDDGIEELGGQLAGGIMTTEAAGETMRPDSKFRRQSELVAKTTSSLVDDGVEVWVHGDTNSGEEGCAANKFWRDILRLGGRTADTMAPTVWAFMVGLQHGQAAKRRQIREFIMAGAARAEDDSFWDATTQQIVEIAQANGAKYHEVDRVHKAACARIDLTPNIFNNAKYRQNHKTQDGLPLGALSITLGAYENNLIKRAERHGYDEVWVAEKSMTAAIFAVAACKKLGNNVAGHQLRLAVIGSRH